MVLPTIFAETSTVVVAQDRTEVRVRAVPDVAPGVDIFTRPRLQLDWGTRRFTTSVAYFPLITIRNLESPDFVGAEMLQQGSFALSWRDRRWRIAASQDGAYGDYNFTYLLPGLAPTGVMTSPQLLPSTSRTLRFASSRTVVALAHRASRFVTLTLQPSFSASGGADEISREQIPFQRGPRVDLIADVTTSRRDRWVTALDASVADFAERSCDPFDGGPPRQPTPTMPNPPLPIRCKADAERVSGSETWSHRFSRWDDLSLSVGGAVVRQAMTPVVMERTSFFPTFAATVVHRFAVMRPDATELRADARVEPVTDVRFGIVDPRLMLTLGTSSRLQRVTFTTRAQLARTIPFDQWNGATLFQQEGEALYFVDRRVAVGLGVRAIWQRQPPLIPNGFFSVISYAVLEIREPIPLR